MAIRNVFGAQSIRQKLLLGTLFLSKEGLSMEKVSGMGDEPQGEGR